MTTHCITARDIIDRLKARYPEKEWATFTELREEPSFGGMRSIDFAAIHHWASKAHKFVCVEVKVTASDFARELADPAKRGPWMERAHEFWFAAPKGVIALDLVPPGCGLLEVWGDKLRAAKPAVGRHDAPGPTFGMWMMMVRDMQEKSERLQKELQSPLAEFAGKPVGLEDLRRIAAETWRDLVSRSARRCESLPRTLAHHIGGRDGFCLQWPTPTAKGYGNNQGGAAGRVGPIRDGLDTIELNWPTPTAMDSKSSGRGSGTTLVDAECRSGHQGAMANGRAGQRKPNPVFREALMGFPLGWSDCMRSVTPSFRKWLRRHGCTSVEGKRDERES